MARDLTIRGRITLDDEASGTLDRVRGKFSQFGDYLKGQFVFGPQDVTRAFRAMTSVFHESIEASAEQERVTRGLDAALSDLGPRGESISRALQLYASELQRSSRFGDEAIIQGQSLLASFLKTEEGIKRASLAAIDFASSGLIDLDSAFKLLAKSAEGNTSVLSRYGITIDESIPKSQRFDLVLKSLNDKFGGRAAADIETYAGTIGQVKNAYGDLLEIAGDVVTQNNAVRESLRGLRDELSSDQTQRNVRGFAELLASLASGTLSFTIAKFNSLARIGQDVGRLLSAVGADVGQFFVPAVQGATTAVDAWSFSLLDAAKEFRVVSDEVANLEDGLKRLEELAARNTRVYKDVADSQGELSLAAARLGVTLTTNVNNSIYENEQALKVFETALKLGVISLREYEAAARATATANKALLASVADPTRFVDGGPIDELKNQLRELGVTLRDDVSKSVSDGDKLWRDALAAYRLGRIDIYELTQTFKLLSQANVTARDEWLGLGDAATASTGALTGAGAALDVTGAAATRFAGNAAAARRELARLNAEAANFAATSQVYDRSGNLLPAGGTLSLGNTRYDLPGGGSVLVGAVNGVRNPASNLGVNYGTGGGSAGVPFSGRYVVNTPQYGTIEAFKVASYGFGPSGAGVSEYGVLPGGRVVTLREW